MSTLERLGSLDMTWLQIEQRTNLMQVVGVLVLAVGAAYLMEDRASILPGFPANTLQAWICIGGGIVTVFIAAVKMLVEVMHAASRGKSAANDGRFS